MKIKTPLSVAILAVVLVATSSPAHADSSLPSPVPDGAEYTVVEPIDATLVIDGEATDIRVMPDFDPKAPAIVLDADGSPVAVNDIELVYGDGARAEVAKVDTTNRAALASCSYNWVAPGTGTWYYSVNGCSFIGLNDSTTVGYSWNVNSNSNGSACLKGRGYVYIGWPTYQNVEFYGSLGCASSGGSNGGTIHWGNVASTKRVQMQSTSVPIGAAGEFS